MKSLLVSIQPKRCEKIVKREETIEVQKTRPKIETPFKCYIYCTIGTGVKGDYLVPSGIQCGKVIGEFVCDWVTKITPHCDVKDFVNQYIHGYPAILGENDCLSFQEMKSYLGNKNGYDWHISDIKIYDKQKELSEFKTGCKGCKERDTYHCKFYCYGERPITRPPQSWQYVEELIGGTK